MPTCQTCQNLNLPFCQTMTTRQHDNMQE
jgi:hypothetical protein